MRCLAAANPVRNIVAVRVYLYKFVPRLVCFNARLPVPPPSDMVGGAGFEPAIYVLQRHSLLAVRVYEFLKNDFLYLDAFIHFSKCGENWFLHLLLASNKIYSTTIGAYLSKLRISRIEPNRVVPPST